MFIPLFGRFEVRQGDFHLEDAALNDGQVFLSVYAYERCLLIERYHKHPLAWLGGQDFLVIFLSCAAVNTTARHRFIFRRASLYAWLCAAFGMVHRLGKRSALREQLLQR